MLELSGLGVLADAVVGVWVPRTSSLFGTIDGPALVYGVLCLSRSIPALAS